MPDVLTVKYPNGPHNAEAMFILGEDVYIVTRDRIGLVFRATVTGDARELVMSPVGSLGIANVTDAETSTDGTRVVVRTERTAFIYSAADISRGTFTPLQQIPLSGLKEPQGEGVALDGSMLYLASEGGSMSNRGRFTALRCELSQTPEEPRP